MKKLTTFAIFLSNFIMSLALSVSVEIGGIYVNTFGDPKKQALVFVHGGPGFNSWDFELTTAPVLAAKGYFVVVYDQRGQGRSKPVDIGQYNYKNYAEDLKMIIDTLKLNRPVLLGHSHGGPISIKFDQQFPGIVRTVALIAAPINFWGSIQSILQNCAKKYSVKNDEEKAASVSYIYSQLFVGPALTWEQKSQMVGMTFYYGMDCGLYKVETPSPEGLQLHGLLKDNPAQNLISAQAPAMPGFLKNEDYVHFNELDYVYENRDHFCGIYGDEDGLFTPLELGLIRNTLQGPGERAKFKIISGASHALYIDQQTSFFDSLKQNCDL